MNIVTEIINIEDIRKYVGLSISEFDDELIILGNTAIKTLQLSGISSNKIVKKDSIIKSTILAYIKANFRNTPSDISEKYGILFEANKNFMRSLKEYTEGGENNG